MSRISHKAPLAAYDHIANMLKDSAGKDGLVSRADAQALVTSLEKGGKGTEALAAQNLFKMIDMQDTRPGARVTGYDLDKSRSFVQEKMLENRDLNSNGFSAAEVAQMSPTGRALVELGQTLEIKAAAGRIAHRVPEQGAEHICALIAGAAGKDGVVSRNDIKALVESLEQQGRGTEKLAAENFFNFIDQRVDPAPGARVTSADIDKALGFARQGMAGEDKNGNGYSKDEIAQHFSPTAKAFLLVGQMIDAGIIKMAG